MITIAVDCMGGDVGPATTLPACEAFLATHPGTRLLLVGLPEALAGRAGLLASDRCTVVSASEVVTMDDTVEVALRRKRDSSMRVAIQQVKSGEAQAAVSAGNTGALMAIARYVLKTLDGIDRPAIATQMPNAQGGATTVLDLGANVDCTAEHLLQFAVMGSALVAASGVESPSVGLLNVGEEVIKGNDVIKQAGQLLRDAAAAGHLHFHGNVPGNDIFKGTTPIVVRDGFVRNVAFKRRVDHRRYNGAALLGLRGLVFKSHGSADAFAFEQALARAYDAAQHQLLDNVKSRIAHAAPLLAPPGLAPEPAVA